MVCFALQQFAPLAIVNENRYAINHRLRGMNQQEWETPNPEIGFSVSIENAFLASSRGIKFSTFATCFVWISLFQVSFVCTIGFCYILKPSGFHLAPFLMKKVLKNILTNGPLIQIIAHLWSWLEWGSLTAPLTCAPLKQQKTTRNNSSSSLKQVACMLRLMHKLSVDEAVAWE